MRPSSMIFTVAVSIVSYFFGVQITNETRNALEAGFEFIQAYLPNTWQRVPAEPPKAMDIAVHNEEFNFVALKKDKVMSMNTSFLNIKQLEQCERMEDTSAKDLTEYIETFGSINNMSEDQIKEMKHSVKTGRRIKSTRMFEHGKTGSFRFIKYASARLDSGNFNFMVAMYGYSWELDSISPEEAVRRIDFSQKISQKEETLAGVPKEVWPEKAAKELVEDVANFVKINSKQSVTLQEKEEMMDYFMQEATKSLGILCPAVNNEK